MHGTTVSTLCKFPGSVMDRAREKRWGIRYSELTLEIRMTLRANQMISPHFISFEIIQSTMPWEASAN